MNLRQNEQQRTLHAPAKLNLFLEILGRRDDGYHELETLMMPVRIFDSLTLQITPASSNGPGPLVFRLRQQVASNPVPADRTNLVVQALERLRQRTGCELGAKVELVKRIPSGAGLGGGSSDAATALSLANAVWGIHWPPHQLAKLAAELGSDVPFFLKHGALLGHGAAVCRGRGEQVEPLATARPLHFVIVMPPIALSTAAVYGALEAISSREIDKRIRSSHLQVGHLASALGRGSINNLGRWMGNRLQTAAKALSPWIGRVQTAFSQFDFISHQLTGSGSAYFGVCRHAHHARRLAAVLRNRQMGLVYVTRSCR